MPGLKIQTAYNNIMDILKPAYDSSNLPKSDYVSYAKAVENYVDEYLLAMRNITNAYAEEKEEPVVVTHQMVIDLWEEIRPCLYAAKAIVAGGFVSAYLNWDSRRAPTDCDVWLPRGSLLVNFPGWQLVNSYSVAKSRTMSPDVEYIREFKKEGFPITIQVLHTRLDDPYDVVNRFDFDVCKGILSPGALPDGSVVGIRATKPEVYRAIMSGETTYTEHPWDISEDGKLNSKALNRFRRYKEKGYIIKMGDSSRYTLRQIEQMLDEQPMETRGGAKSYYEVCNDARYDGTLVGKISACFSMSSSLRYTKMPEYLEFKKVVTEYMKFANRAGLSIPLKYASRTVIRDYYDELDRKEQMKVVDSLITRTYM